MNFKKITLALAALVALNSCAPALGYKPVISIKNQKTKRSVKYQAETAREYANDIVRGTSIGALEGIITAAFAAAVANKFSPENTVGKAVAMGAMVTLFSHFDIIEKVKSTWNWIRGKKSGPKYVTRETARKNMRRATILCTLIAATSYGVDKYTTPLYDGTKLLCYNTPKLILYDTPRVVIGGCVAVGKYVKDGCVAVGNYVKNTRAGSLYNSGPVGEL